MKLYEFYTDEDQDDRGHVLGKYFINLSPETLKEKVKEYLDLVDEEKADFPFDLFIEWLKESKKMEVIEYFDRDTTIIEY